MTGLVAEHKNMMNKKRIARALIVGLWGMVVQFTYAGNAENHLSARAYHCAGFTEPLQSVYINLGGRRGFVQLDVPVTASQPVSINVLKRCLLEHSLMSKEEFLVYSKALDVCRRSHHQKKVQYSRGSITNISTSKSFNFDYCLRDNLLD